MHNIIINNLKKTSLLSIVIILYGNLIMASSMDAASDTGIITLTIVNRPPVITSINFDKETAFEDSPLKCISSVNDENPVEVRLIYNWYVNNKLVEASNNYITGFKENDLVGCEVTPIDNEDVFGETKSVSIAINKRSAISKVTSFVIKNYNINLFAVFTSLF